MPQKNFLTFTTLFSFFSLYSAIEVQHCLRYHQISSNTPIYFSCAQCERGFILISDGSSCIEAELRFVNCIKLSVLGECMQCECGYSLQLEKSICIPTPLNITGCEIFKGDSTCVRPKQDFTLFEESVERSFVEFSRGSRCEIWNISSKYLSTCLISDED